MTELEKKLEMLVLVVNEVSRQARAGNLSEKMSTLLDSLAQSDDEIRD